MPTSSEQEYKYCSLCDEYFISKELLHQHMQSSRSHPRCTTCKRSYLNMNSLRNHYVYSSRHHYCRACEKSFKTASGLRIHLEQSFFHRDDTDDDDDDDDDDGDDGPDGWEDEVARLQDEAERRQQTEDEIIFDESDDNYKSPIAVKTAVLKLKSRTTSTTILRYNCPVCLSAPRSVSVSATRCGHLFCTPCIEHVFEQSGTCPTCRKPGVLPQLREIDLRLY